MTITVSDAILYDDFKNGVYTLADGQTSPNGKWKNAYNGGGYLGVKIDNGNKNVFFMYPKTSTNYHETNANLVKSTQRFSNFNMDIDAKTVEQLRRNSPPNNWEAAWILFRYTDDFHYYWFVLKPTGVELGKKDCGTCTIPYQGQIYLYTNDIPHLKIGSWSNWKITAIGNHITMTVDGDKVVDYVDTTMSPQLSSGGIAMYNEDAYAQFDNIYDTPHKIIISIKGFHFF